jgi:hypothetical protein
MRLLDCRGGHKVPPVHTVSPVRRAIPMPTGVKHFLLECASFLGVWFPCRALRHSGYGDFSTRRRSGATALCRSLLRATRRRRYFSLVPLLRLLKWTHKECKVRKSPVLDNCPGRWSEDFSNSYSRTGAGHGQAAACSTLQHNSRTPNGQSLSQSFIHFFRVYGQEVDFEYFSSLVYSVLVALATFSIVYDAPSSFLPSGGLALCAFWGTFTLLFVVAHRRESLLLRYWLYKRRRATKTRIGGNRG